MANDGEQQLFALHGDPDEAPFERVLRGFDMRQVLAYMAKVQQVEAELIAERDAAYGEAEAYAEEVRQLQMEVLNARRETVSSEPASFAHLGYRIEQILQLAEDEATEMRARAEEDAESLRGEAEELVEAARVRAAQIEEDFARAVAARREEAQKEQARMRADIERDNAEKTERAATVLAEAQQEAARLRAQVRQEISDLRDKARSEADALIAEAREEAESVLAEARAAAEQERSHGRNAARHAVEEARAEARRVIEGIRTEVTDLSAQRAQVNNELAKLREALSTLGAGMGFGTLPTSPAEAPAPQAAEAAPAEAPAGDTGPRTNGATGRQAAPNGPPPGATPALGVPVTPADETAPDANPSPRPKAPAGGPVKAGPQPPAGPVKGGPQPADTGETPARPQEPQEPRVVPAARPTFRGTARVPGGGPPRPR